MALLCWAWRMGSHRGLSAVLLRVVALLLAITLGGGMWLIHSVAATWFSGPYLLGLAIFAGLMVVGAMAMAMYELFSVIEKHTTGWAHRGSQGE